MTEYTIGVDLGGTNLRAAAIDRAGKILHNASGPTPVKGGRDAVINDIVQLIRSTQSALSDQNLRGVGIGIPGYILMDQGIVVGAPNLPELVNYPVRDEIEKRLGARIVLENDANAAAIGEKWFGGGRHVNDLVMLTLGTGIGGGIIIDGNALHGELGMAAELGHVTVVPNGNPCGCGNRGCIEKYASATAVSAMAKMLNLGADLTAEEVYRLAREGNDRAKMIFDSVGTSLGNLLASLINIFNAPLYLIGGGMSAAWDQFEPAMTAEISRRSFTYRTHPPRIERAKLGSDAGLYGAAWLGWAEASTL
jgi:glucokinase